MDISDGDAAEGNRSGCTRSAKMASHCREGVESGLAPAFQTSRLRRMIVLCRNENVLLTYVLEGSIRGHRFTDFVTFFRLLRLRGDGVCFLTPEEAF